ncbi:MAG: glycosyltransferase family 2 protein, partial [Lacisediminihabitans sp.]
MSDVATRVTVVTVAYHSDEVLPAFLESVRGAMAAPPSVFVINNAPDDPNLTERLPPSSGLEVVEPGLNLGYGRAMNLGVSLSPASRWMLLANPDLTFADGAIDELLRVGESEPGIGVVGPLILTPAGEVYPSARKLPSLRDGIGHALFARVWKSNPWTRSYLEDRQTPPRQRDAGWLSGACLLLRRDALDQVGGFDEKFFMYFEDVDLCARVGRADWRIVYAPSAVVTHLGAHSTKNANRAM